MYWRVVNGIRKSNFEEMRHIKIGDIEYQVSDNAEKIAEEFNIFYNEIPEKLIEEEMTQDIDQDANDERGERDDQNSFCERCGRGGLTGLTVKADDVERTIHRFKK